jgi:ribosomal protein S12 methylthiotransferase
LKARSIKKDKVNVITLGCSKNLVDSENIMTQLKANDIDVAHEREDDDANIIIVNTCGFIDLAKEESVNTILQYAEEKKQGNIDKLYVTGCLSQRYKDDLEAEIPEVDAFFGTMELPGILAKFNADYKHELVGEKVLTTPNHYAYLKISEGCNRTCSFCAIPLMRGKHISKTIEDLVKEAKGLAKMGVKEIMLIAQELTYYGLDLYKERALPQLLDALCEVEGIEWIRLHYAYPSKFPLEIFDVMARQPKICNYLDIPLQHASDDVLFRMKRQITRQEQTELINEARRRVPGIAIRTTFLVGFPGESEDEFEDLIDFIKEMRFERVGVFQYSHEEDTSAHDIKDDVDAELKGERASYLMEVQQEISNEKNHEKVGQTFKVLF